MTFRTGAMGLSFNDGPPARPIADPVEGYWNTKVPFVATLIGRRCGVEDRSQGNAILLPVRTPPR